MTQIKTSKGEFMFPEIPKDAFNLQLRDGALWFERAGIDTEFRVQLPSGTYEFMFTTVEATEEQAAMVVEDAIIGYRNYFANYLLRSSLNSVYSLLRAHSLNADNYACIRIAQISSAKLTLDISCPLWYYSHRRLLWVGGISGAHAQP